MKLSVCYIYPLGGQGHHGARALKFLDTYHKFPPCMDHETIVVCNGGPANEETRFMFDSLPNLRLIEHDDSGQDVGGYQLAAKNTDAGMMLFCGGNSYFKRGGWLIRMVQAFQEFGDTLYGSTGNQGDMRFGVYPHVRTTGFWCSPSLMNRHPFKVTNNGQRYAFEHGQPGITTWVLGQNKQCWIVAWDGVYSVHNCNSIMNGFRTGDGTNILVGDRMTEAPYGSDSP